MYGPVGVLSFQYDGSGPCACCRPYATVSNHSLQERLLPLLMVLLLSQQITYCIRRSSIKPRRVEEEQNGGNSLRTKERRGAKVHSFEYRLIKNKKQCNCFIRDEHQRCKRAICSFALLS